MSQVIKTAKQFLLPRGREYRRVRAGIAHGCWLPMSYQNDLRMMWGVFERPLIPWIREFFHDSRVAYDIGNAEGYYTLAFLRLAAPGGRVVAFEANPRINREFRATMERNGIQGRVELIEAMVGDGSRRETVAVDAAILDRRLPQPDVVKIDVEGAEVQVLHGMEQTFRRAHPRLILEVHSAELEKQSDELLQSWGYRTGIVDLGFVDRLFREYRPMPHNRWLVAHRK